VSSLVSANNMAADRLAHLRQHLEVHAVNAAANAPVTVYIANRGIVVQRIARAARLQELRVAGGFGASDAGQMWTSSLDVKVPLKGDGPLAYLDIAQHVQAARAAGAQLVHPGIGFLSESGAFAQAVADAGMVFVGPSPQALALFGDKRQTCDLAARLGIPVLSLGVVPPPPAVALSAEQRANLPVIFKSVSGGGGLGLRVVRDAAQAAQMYARCVSESGRSFEQSPPLVIAEKFLQDARHVEVQVVGDGTRFAHCGDRDCSIQRRFQKLVEMAPCPHLLPETRRKLHVAALALAQAAKYVGVCTVEFLVDRRDPLRYYLIEVNPRLQVEHTVSEEAFGVDLCQAQLLLAQGRALDALGASWPGGGERGAPACVALQVRVCGETMRPGGLVVASQGTLTACDFPRGNAVRVETLVHCGYSQLAGFDSLLAQVVFRLALRPGESAEAGLARLVRLALGGLAEVRLQGMDTNLGLLREILERGGLGASTRFVDTHLPELLLAASASAARAVYPDLPVSPHALASHAPELPQQQPVEDEEEQGAVVVRAPMACTRSGRARTWRWCRRSRWSTSWAAPRAGGAWCSRCWRGLARRAGAGMCWRACRSLWRNRWRGRIAGMCTRRRRWSTGREPRWRRWRSCARGGRARRKTQRGRPKRLARSGG
jgi:acetyl/propionyl-CoA carboxylase alpha subunit